MCVTCIIGVWAVCNVYDSHYTQLIAQTQKAQVYLVGPRPGCRWWHLERTVLSFATDSLVAVSDMRARHTMHGYLHTSLIKSTIYCVKYFRDTCTHLVAFIWIDRKRFEDADCVSVRCSNLKVKRAAFVIKHYSPHQCFRSVTPRGEGYVGRGAEKCKYGWIYNFMLCTRTGNNVFWLKWKSVWKQVWHLPCPAGGSTPHSPPVCFHSELLGWSERSQSHTPGSPRHTLSRRPGKEMKSQT